MGLKILGDGPEFSSQIWCPNSTEWVKLLVMEQVGGIKPILRRLVFKKVILVVMQALLRGAAAGLIILTLGVILDAVFAFGTAVRDFWRYLGALAAMALAGRDFFSKRAMLGLGAILSEIEGRLDLAHDPLKNYLDLLKVDFSTTSLTRELAAREFERARDLVAKRSLEIGALFGWKDLFFHFKPVFWISMAGGPLIALAIGTASGAGACSGIWRILRPYQEVERFGREMVVDPVVGNYKMLKGSSVNLSVISKVAAPRQWGEPVIEVNDEPRPMVFLGDDDAGRRYFFGISALTGDIRLILRWGEFRAGPWIFEAVEPPGIKTLTMTVSPPAYSKQPRRQEENPSIVEILEESLLSFEIVSGEGLKSATIFLEDENGLKRQWNPAQPWTDGKVKIEVWPQHSGRLRVALESELGIVNSEAWVMMLIVRKDELPNVAIIDPVFYEIEMDVEEELPVSWQAQDDVGVVAVDAVMASNRVKVPETRRRWWSSPAQTQESIKGMDHFKPSSWGLDAGDEAIVVLQARDARPGRPEASQSREALRIKVKNFEQTHQENLERRNEELQEALMKHLEEGLELSQEMSQGSSETINEMASKIDAYEKKEEHLERQLRDYAKELEADPLASPSWSWGVERVASAFDSAAASHLKSSEREARQGNQEIAQEQFSKYVEQTEKAVEAFDELRKEQKMQDALSSSAKLDELAERISDSLENPEDLKDLQDALEALDQEMRELAKVMSEMNPKEYPQEFVNQIRPEDVPLQQAADARTQLEEALREGDFKKAAAKAKEMAESIKKMRQEFEEAAETQKSKSMDRLGGSAQENEGAPTSLAQDLEALKKEQEQLVWKSSALERSMKAYSKEKSDSSLDEAENDRAMRQNQEAAEKLAQEQKDVSDRTKKLFGEFAELDREFPQLVLGSKINKLQGAIDDQEQASQELSKFSLTGALEKESAALQKMQELGDELNEMAEQMSKSSMSMPGSKGQSRPIVFMPSSGASSGQGAGSNQGMRLDRVSIPSPEDYKVPEGNRREILRSLRERGSSAEEDAVGEYLRNLLK